MSGRHFFLFKEAPFMRRPWGSMVRLIHVDSFWVKILYIKHGKRTSDQLHRERTEYHVRLPYLLHVKKYLPGVRHRLGPGIYLEVAFGKPREDDIERFEDDYGRVK